MSDTPQTGHDASTDIDLYCMQCGYNLRGLHGDALRCPECGYENPLEFLLLPAERVAKQLLMLEEAPTRTFAGTIMILIGAGMLNHFIPMVGTRIVRLIPVVLCSYVVLAGIVMWVHGVIRFAASCLHRPGWVALLLRFHVYATAMFVLIFAMVIGVLVMWRFSYMQRRIPQLGMLSAYTGVIVAWAICAVVIRKLYRRTRAELAVLQREVAVAMYKSELDGGVHRV